MKSNVILHQLPLGSMENFIYILGDPETKEAAVIDPAWDVKKILAAAQKNGLNITAIFLTHGHHDHVNGIDALQTTHDVPVYMSQHEAGIFTPKCKGLVKIKPNHTLTLGKLKIDCLHTPGHSPGCQCFMVGDTLIAGDAIFIDGCGRCDLPGSDPKAMYHSLYEVIMKLPDSTVIYPGHDYGPTPFATVGEQKKTNPYLQCKNLEEFLMGRMGMTF